MEVHELRGPIRLLSLFPDFACHISTTHSTMFSPFRPRDAPPASLGPLPEPELPLHLALAWLVVKATPVNAHGHPINVYSPTFVAAVLEIVAREVLEVSVCATRLVTDRQVNPAPVTFGSLKAETDRLIVKEAVVVARLNDKRMSRGQIVSAEAEEAAAGASWMDIFVSYRPFSHANGSRNSFTK